MRSFLRVAAASVVLFGALTTVSPARGDDSLTRLREIMKREPKAPDVVRMALDYYRVSPEAMDSLRSSARAISATHCPPLQRSQSSALSLALNRTRAFSPIRKPPHLTR